MPKNQKGAGSILIVLFLTVILAVGAFFIYQNYQVNLKSGASNVLQSAKGKLVKKGSSAFNPCGKNANFTYGLVGVQVLGLEVEAATAPTSVPGSTLSPIPKPTLAPPTNVPTPIPTSTAVPGHTSTPIPRTPPGTPKTNACLPLSVPSSLADKFVNKQVTVQGTLQNGIFYVTSINGINVPTPTPRLTPTPTPYVRVSYPNGSEQIARGTTVTLGWYSGGVSNVSFYVVNSQGVISLINGATSNPNGGYNTYNWVANPPNYINDPNTSSNIYKIRVTDSSGKYIDESDNYFTIFPTRTPPPPTTTPIPMGKCYSVKVTGGTFGGNIGGKDLYFIESGGTVDIIANTQPANTQVNWKVVASSVLLNGTGTFSKNNAPEVLFTAPTNTSGSDQGLDIRGDISEYPNPVVSCPTFTLGIHTQ